MSDSIDRRGFLAAVGVGSLALSAGSWVQRTLAADAPSPEPWKPTTDRRIRFGIVGYGVCRFGAEFSFQNHPNVEVVAVSDLFADRRQGLMKACRCDKSYDSLEELVKDPKIEAVFVATDAPSHARHCIECMNHGKHVITAVPAVCGAVDDAAKLVETVRKTKLKYMMAETSYFRPDCYAMRQIYRAGGFGRLVYSEGEYYHFGTVPIASYKDWRTGMPPLWYPTHSTAYYVGVTGKRFTSVSCVGFKSELPHYKDGKNAYNNPFGDEIALFQTSEGGASRMGMWHSISGLIVETGRVYGEKGWMNELTYKGEMKSLPNVAKPALPPGVVPGGHGGSHGYLCHEFVSSILEDREPAVNVYESLALTVPGIIAHQSALRGGETMKVPQFDA